MTDEQFAEAAACELYNLNYLFMGNGPLNLAEFAALEDHYRRDHIRQARALLPLKHQCELRDQASYYLEAADAIERGEHNIPLKEQSCEG